MATKTMESLNSKKFDSKNVSGGNNPTTYGPARETRYDGFGGQNGDTAAMTYNPADKPAGSQGLDYIKS